MAGQIEPMKNTGPHHPRIRWAAVPLAGLFASLIWFTAPAAAATSAAATAVTAPTIITPSDGYSTVTRAPVFTGTAAVGETVKLDIDGSVVAATTSSTGSWTLTPSTALAVGQHSVFAVGCISGSCHSSNSQQLNELPSTPNVSSPADGSSAADQTPAISGTADPGDTVTLYLDNSYLPLGTTSAGGSSGTWSLTLADALPPDNYGIYAVATDPNSGLQSSNSATDDFTVLPPAPVITTPHANVTITSSASSPSTQVCGNAAVGEAVDLMVNGADAASTSTGPFGTWCATAATPYGVDSLIAVGTDSAGDENPSSTIAIAVQAASTTSSVTTTTTTTTTTPTTAVKTATSKVTLSVPRQMRLSLTNALKVKCALSPLAIRSCTVTIKAHGKVIGKATRRFKNNKTHSATVTVKLTKAGVKLVKKAGKKGLKVSMTLRLVAVNGVTFKAGGASIVRK